MKKPKSFTVNRKRWLHGEGGQESSLYRPRDKKMCCLGFYARACGLKVADIVDVRTPAMLAEQGLVLPDLVNTNDRMKDAFGEIKFTNLSTTSEMMAVNDRPSREAFTDSNREATLTDYFATIGVEVKFV